MWWSQPWVWSSELLTTICIITCIGAAFLKMWIWSVNSKNWDVQNLQTMRLSFLSSNITKMWDKEFGKCPIWAGHIVQSSIQSWLNSPLDLISLWSLPVCYFFFPRINISWFSSSDQRLWIFKTSRAVIEKLQISDPIKVVGVITSPISGGMLPILLQDISIVSPSPSVLSTLCPLWLAGSRNWTGLTKYGHDQNKSPVWNEHHLLQL